MTTSQGTISEESKSTFIIPWRLWIALIFTLPIADICLYQISHIGVGFALGTTFISLMGVYVSRGQGRFIGIAFLFPSIIVSAFNPSLVNILAITMGFTILFWKKKTDPLSWNLIDLPITLISTPFIAFGLFLKTLRNISSPSGNHLRKSQKLIRILFPTLVVSFVFFVFLCAGNAILARWTLTFSDHFISLLKVIMFPDSAHILFWILTVIISVIILVPAWLCQQENIKQRSLKSPMDISKNKSLLRLQFISVLIGVNMVFMLTNTLDAIYLWIRKSPPSGISTTEYLYEGFYILILTTILAGLLLAFIFNHSDSVKNKKTLIILATAWVIQNLFLIAGVAFRLWLHIDKYCLTPRRLEVGLLLILITIGFILLLVYIIHKRSLEWLVSSSIVTTFLFVFIVQFLDIGKYCVNSAIHKLKENPELTFNTDFFKSVGISGWQLLEVMENNTQNSDKSQSHYAHTFWNHLQNNATHAPKPFLWQDFAYCPYSESKAICEKLNIPSCDMRKAWNKTIRDMYNIDRKNPAANKTY